MLHANSLAHCDVKANNMGVRKGEGKLLLIDADDMKRFGEPREVGTKDVNISREDYDKLTLSLEVVPCKASTDLMGFESVERFVNEARATAAITKNTKLTGHFVRFSGKAVKENIDILFLLDCTGSMAPWIAGAKEAAESMLKFMHEYYPNSTLRAAFVGYRDFDDGADRFVIEGFTTDIAKISRTI